MRKSDCRIDPFAQFQVWFKAAQEASLPEPGAMTLATADSDGTPSARIVLLRGVDETGFVFFTNYESRKSRELSQNPVAALVFYWEKLHRQIRITGAVERMLKEESTSYFHSRPKGSQIAAWASNQSEVLTDRHALEDTWKRYEDEFADKEIPLPPDWGGFRLKPNEFEFWEGRSHRMHDRFRYRVTESGWVLERIAP